MRKIDIYYQQGKHWHYACSTMQHKTCKSAVKSWADIHCNGDTTGIKARFTPSGI